MAAISGVSSWVRVRRQVGLGGRCAGREEAVDVRGKFRTHVGVEEVARAAIVSRPPRPSVVVVVAEFWNPATMAADKITAARATRKGHADDLGGTEVAVGLNAGLRAGVRRGPRRLVRYGGHGQQRHGDAFARGREDVHFTARAVVVRRRQSSKVVLVSPMADTTTTTRCPALLVSHDALSDALYGFGVDGRTATLHDQCHWTLISIRYMQVCTYSGGAPLVINLRRSRDPARNFRYMNG